LAPDEEFSTLAAQARALGLPANTWRGCRAGSEPGADTIRRIVSHTGCDPYWLLGVKSPSAAGGTTGRVDAGRVAEPIEDQYFPARRIRVVGAAAADETAGARTIDEFTEGEYYQVPKGRVLVRVIGGSMAPIAYDGQILIVSGQERSVRNDDLVVVWSRKRGALFKRAYPERRAGKVVRYNLYGVNPVTRPEPFSVTLAELIDIRVVVGVLYE